MEPVKRFEAPSRLSGLRSEIYRWCKMVGKTPAKIPRAHQRKQVLWNTELHQEGRIWPCKAVDISPRGAKIRIDERLAVGSWVVLVIEDLGSFPGEVRWQDKSFTGIRFLQDAAAVGQRLQHLSRTTEM